MGRVAVSATIIAINDIDYRYDAGVFYEPAAGGYKAVDYQPVQDDNGQAAYEVVEIEDPNAK